MHLNNYLSQLASNPDLVSSIRSTINSVIPNHIKNFSYKSHLTGLLLGNVQSGKTGQMFGIISAAADEGFNVFVLLTTDNIYLQQQTFKRALATFDSFNICGEDDDVRFFAQQLKKPLLIILKKNTNILQKWRNNLATSKFCEGRPLVIIDDEADAASLNTKINQNDQSQINVHLESIKNLASSSIYIQVTATPQALLLQTMGTGWKPSFVHYFDPGKHYLGGDFFYSDPISSVIRLTKENELDDLRQISELIADGLEKSLMTFLVTASHIHLSEGKVCNFLIHPSVRISDHETIAEKIGEYLNLILSTLTEDSMKERLKDNLRYAWEDLRKTKQNILKFEAILSFVYSILDGEKVKICVMNSKNTLDINLSLGINIIVGGNSLGRGVTFPSLQTVYYCRQAKIPQADTFWQHCRMFGYDRDPDLMRVYIPPTLLKLFTDLNNANVALIDQINKIGLDKFSLLYPPKINPTRKNVLDKEEVNIIVGGVNFFSDSPTEINRQKIDELLQSFDNNRDYTEINIDFALQILSLIETETGSDWINIEFINALTALKAKNDDEKVILIVRTNRSISKNTGTLLSPTDRKLGDSFNISVLTLYRIIGEKEKGWEGKPLWIPNIKLPKGMNFYKTNN